ncbi:MULTISPECIES: DMT family transporter [Anaerolinea]|uniref:DMT family transporter n=1 Tax=Anaerolinea TaxID=233189 RepID=UPI002612B8BB|nr:DMT family transporter [Anaerolinea thermophila]
MWRSNALLLVVTAIWGMGFVAQRVGMEHVGVFTYNTLRFGMGVLALFLFLPLVRRFEPLRVQSSARTVLKASLLAGVLLFIASTLQTEGLVYTTAGKAGFITGLYVVLVPVLGLLWRQRTHPATWMGAVLAVAGLYLLSVNEALQISRGDWLVLASAFFWAAHIQALGFLTRRADPVHIAIGQFVVVTLLSLPGMLGMEHPALADISAASGAILYGGLMVVGVSFTLQVIAQREAHPAHAAVIMVSEAVFAVLAGWLLLGERLSMRGIAGCVLMTAGMVLSALAPYLHARMETPTLQNQPVIEAGKER